MDKRRHWLFLFMRRNVGRHKQDLPQRKSFRGGLRQGQVSAVNWVEASAEKADVHWSFTGSSPSVSCFPAAVASLCST
jgi:hypothetical protein